MHLFGLLTSFIFCYFHIPTHYNPMPECGLSISKPIKVSAGIIETQHEISNNVVYANGIASDQPAHTRRLIRAFASRLNIL